MTDIAKYTVRLEAATAEYEKSLKKATQKVNRFNSKQRKALDSIKSGFKTLATAAVASFAAITAASVTLTRDLDRIAKKAKEADIGTDTFQAWEFAATQAGVSTEQFSAGLGRALRSIGLFRTDGTGPAAKSLERLGIAVNDANGGIRSQESIIRDYVKALEGIEDQAGRTAEVTALFGDDARQLAQVFGNGVAELERFEQQAKDLGIIIGGDTLKAAEDFTDQMDILSRTLKASLAKNMSELLPSFSKITAAIVDMTQQGESASLFFRGINELMLLTAAGGLRLANTFTNVGRTIGGVAAAITQAIKGNPGDASKTLAQLTKDNEAAAARLEAAIVKLRAPAGGGGGPSSDPVPEVSQLAGTKADAIASANIYANQLYSQLGVAYANAAKVATGGVDEGAEKLRRELESLGQFNDRSSGTTTDVGDNSVFDRIDKINAKAEAAGENFSQIFGANMVQAAESGFDSLLLSWAKTIQQMMAQLLASKLFDLLAGIGGGGEGTFGGFVSGLFGGARAAGGPVSSGRSYLVGEKGPELFTPRSSGNIIPNGGGGGMVINIDAPNADMGVIPRIEAAVERAVAISTQKRLEAQRRG